MARIPKTLYWRHHGPELHVCVSRRGRILRARLVAPPRMKSGMIGRISDVVFYGYIDTNDVEYVPVKIVSRDSVIATFGEIG